MTRLCSITRQRHLANIECEPGLCTDFLKLLKLEVEKMSEQGKCCALNIDEMALQPKYEYDSSTKQYVGHITLPLSEKQQEKRIKQFGKYDSKCEIAHHAMNAFLYGMSTFWKQLIAFHFTGLSFSAKAVAEWIVAMIKQLQSINLKLLLVSMDSGKSNLAV